MWGKELVGSLEDWVPGSWCPMQMDPRPSWSSRAKNVCVWVEGEWVGSTHAQPQAPTTGFCEVSAGSKLLRLPSPLTLPLQACHPHRHTKSSLANSATSLLIGHVDCDKEIG